MSEKKKVNWILSLALSLMVAACSSDVNSDRPDTGTNDDSGMISNNGNNTSGGDECTNGEHCDRVRDRGDFLNPGAVECRLIPQTGFRECVECLSNEECPEYYRCSRGRCSLDSNQIDLNCETDAECAYLEELDYFFDFSRVSCRENANGAQVCAECMSDEDCPDRPKCFTESAFPYVCGPFKLAPDMGVTDMDAGDMSAFDTVTSDMNAADAGD